MTIDPDVCKYAILLMDDDWDTIKGLASELIVARGVNCDSAKSPTEARDKLSRIPYRLLVVDMRWEDDEGIQDAGGLQLVLDLCRGKLGELNRDIPYVLVSAQAYRSKVLEAAFDEGDAHELQVRRLGLLEKGDRIMDQASKIVSILASLEPSSL